MACTRVQSPDSKGRGYLSRYMGASLTMIDRHYGHLARDGREHAIRLLDELSSGQCPRWTPVDAGWTPNSAAAVGEE